MTAEENRILGGLQTAMEAHGRQLGSLFEKTDEIRNLIAAQNGALKLSDERITANRDRIARVENVMLKAVVVALTLAFGGAAGVTLVKEMILR